MSSSHQAACCMRNFSASIQHHRHRNAITLPPGLTVHCRYSTPCVKACCMLSAITWTPCSAKTTQKILRVQLSCRVFTSQMLHRRRRCMTALLACSPLQYGRHCRSCCPVYSTTGATLVAFNIMSRLSALHLTAKSVQRQRVAHHLHIRGNYLYV